jgi:hypothetical protein
MPKGISLHLGLNGVDPAHYEGWAGPLNACEADAATMENICQASGLTPRVLLTAEATRDAVITAIGDAAATLEAGDLFVLSYSGHGGQIPDINGDEADGLDETWCLYDGELLDDELYALWSAFAAKVRIVVFSDSCHSGTVVRQMMALRAEGSAIARAPEFAYRVMPPDVQRRTYLAHRDFYDELVAARSAKPDIVCSIILVSGCQDNQLSQDGAFNGAFTGVLSATWNNGGFRGNYRSFTQKIRSRLPFTQSPNYLADGVPNQSFEDQQIFEI